MLHLEYGCCFVCETSGQGLVGQIYFHHVLDFGVFFHHCHFDSTSLSSASLSNLFVVADSDFGSAAAIVVVYLHFVLYDFDPSRGFDPDHELCPMFDQSFSDLLCHDAGLMLSLFDLSLISQILTLKVEQMLEYLQFPFSNCALKSLQQYVEAFLLMQQGFQKKMRMRMRISRSYLRQY